MVMQAVQVVKRSFPKHTGLPWALPGCGWENRLEGHGMWMYHLTVLESGGYNGSTGLMAPAGTWEPSVLYSLPASRGALPLSSKSAAFLTPFLSDPPVTSS